MDNPRDYKNHAFCGHLYFLSNMYPCPVTMPDGIKYRCAEAAFQAQKCLDVDERRRFANMSGKEAKYAGKRVNLRPHWNQIRVGVMRDVVHAKFVQNPDLAKRLADTEGDLVEYNTWGDRFWGVYLGVGKNHLGCLLMETRAKLQR